MPAYKNTYLFLLPLMLFLSSKCIGQEANIWYFGNNAGVNFNINPPQILTDGKLNSLEGCASICDKTGKLLFYTDGVRVYNRNHLTMVNGTGLLGNVSTTQSCIIIPHPANKNLFYIFTGDCFENNYSNGYNYSVVDMRLEGGLGAVTNEKNIRLYAPSTERLTAIKAANGNDYWVITKGFNNNRFTVYKVDCNGIDTTNPVAFNVGTVHEYTLSSFSSGTGALKISPDGKKACVAITGPVALAELFDFNTATGVLSNPIQLTGYEIGGIYGIEFSPNSKLLYVSTFTEQSIDQYDISSNNSAVIEASRYTIPTPGFLPGGMQLTPDKRIFIALNTKQNLSVINNPDVSGPGCNYSQASFNLGGKISTIGLPTYPTSLLTHSAFLDFTNSFINCHNRFIGTSPVTGIVEWYWEFGDGSFDSGQSVNHAYRRAGTYNVTLTAYRSHSVCNMMTMDTLSITKTVVIDNVFGVDFGYKGACSNQPVQFNDSTILAVGSITARTWDFGDGSPPSNAVNPIHTYALPGLYNVKLRISTNGVCNGDSIIKRIYIDTKPTSIFTPVNGCENSPIAFIDNSVNTTGGIGQWKWFFGDGDSSVLKDPMHTFLRYGNYNVQLQSISQHGCPGDPVIKPVVVDSKPTGTFNYNFPCVDKPTVFISSSANISGNITGLAWKFGDGGLSSISNPIHQYSTAGFYDVGFTIHTTNGCTTTISKKIEIKKGVANAGRDTVALYDYPHQLTGSGGASFLWAAATHLSDATVQNPTARLLAEERFTLTTVSAEGCVATDDVLVKVTKNFDIYVPAAFTPNGDQTNDILKPLLYGVTRLNYFRIYNRFGQVTFSTQEAGKGWDGKINDIPQSTGAYVWIVEGIDLFGRTITKKGTTLLIK